MREAIVGAVPDGAGRQHVKDRERIHLVRVVERGTIGHPAATIMTSEEEALKAKLP